MIKFNLINLQKTFSFIVNGEIYKAYALAQDIFVSNLCVEINQIEFSGFIHAV